MRRALLLLLALAFVVGCGPIRSTVGLIEAEKVVRQARDSAGAEAAPYPMTVAEDLLAKAREEQMYADYSRSFQLAKEARAMAQQVIDAAPEVSIVKEITAVGVTDPFGALKDGGQIDPSVWGDDDDSAGDDDDSAGDDDDSAQGDDDDSAGDDDDSAGDDDDSGASP